MKSVKANTPNFISNKLLIIIVIFITVLLIAVICYSMGKKELFSSGKEIHYYSLSTCPHCHDFDPVWQSFQKKSERCHKYVVDEDDQGKANADKYNVHRSNFDYRNYYSSAKTEKAIGFKKLEDIKILDKNYENYHPIDGSNNLIEEFLKKIN